MKRTLRLVEQADGDVGDGDVPEKVTSIVRSTFADVGKVDGVQVDELHGKVDFAVEGVGWKAAVQIWGDGSAKVTVHDTTAEGLNATLAQRQFKEADVDDALGAVYEFIASNLEEE